MPNQSFRRPNSRSWAHCPPIRILGLLAIALALMVLLFPAQTSAHAELVRSSPAADAILSAPPENLQFWFTERIATDPFPPTVTVTDENGNKLETKSVEVDPNDPYHVIAAVDGFSTGTYTVNWSEQSVDDGHSLSGTFGFRIGTGQAPGAATTSGETPAPWAVLLRWLTFLGASTAAAGLIWIGFTALVDPDDRQKRRGAIAMIAAWVALVATALEPLFQSRFPPEGITSPTISEAIAGLPTAWWFRPAGLIVAILALTIMHFVRQKTIWKPVGIVGALGALVALLGLAFTTHAAARETWSTLAKLSISLHEWSVGLWAGGLIMLALAWPRGSAGEGGRSPGRDALRQFSKFALVLAPIGIATGVLNSGLILPSLDSLWQSDWGRTLIVKIIILVPVMILAARHFLWLRKHLERLGSVLRMSVRIEAVLLVGVILAAAVLALSAPPTKSTGSVTSIDLGAPLPGDTEQAEAVHLIMTPMRAGQNEIRVRTALLDQTATGEVTPVQRVKLDLISLNHDVELRDIDLTSDPETGDFVSTGVQFTTNGWWQVDVLVRRAGMEDEIVPFVMMIPDPNINGFDAPKFDGSDPEAQALYEKALATEAAWKTVRYEELLTSGIGGIGQSSRIVNTGEDGSIQSSLLKGSGIEILTIGDTSWQRTADSEWIERTFMPIFPPSEWGESYDGATDFQLGREMEIDGHMTRVVTLFVPATDVQIAAWYAWWIDEETGDLRREVMISRLHYMRWHFFDINEPVNLQPPAGSPVASPQASPVAIPVATPGASS